MDTQALKNEVISSIKDEFYLIPKQTDKQDRSDKVLQLLKHFVCEYYGVSVNKLNDKSRKREVANVRQVICFIASNITGVHISMSQIGKHITRDHSTVLHSIRTVTDELEFAHKKRAHIFNIEQSFFTKYGEELKIYQIKKP